MSFDTIRIDTDARGVATLWLARADKHKGVHRADIKYTITDGTFNLCACRRIFRIQTLEGFLRHFDNLLTTRLDLCAAQAVPLTGAPGSLTSEQKTGGKQYEQATKAAGVH